MSIPSSACIKRDPTGETRPTSLELENTRKRRRDDEVTCSIDNRPLILRVCQARQLARKGTDSIQANPSDPFAKPTTFTPLCLLSRSRLPLAYLDTAQDGGRLFAAHVQVLEACHDYTSDASVLIVEEPKERKLYAIERVESLKYAICRLGIWVKTEDVLKRSTAGIPEEAPPAKRQALQPEQQGRPWWAKAAVDTEHGISGPPKPGHPRLSMLSRKDIAAGTATGKASGQIGDPHPQLADETPADMTLKPTPETLEHLAKQYLETLYLSRTPVAYFVKGPLARVRAAFAAQPSELTAFLRGAVLSSTTTDKKYRETIAELIKESPILDTPGTKPKKQKKRKWKPTRDKSGFFVSEKDLVEQWWRKDDDSHDVLNSSETIDAAIRRRSQRLRSRETFLQVILILEVLALEASDSPTSVPQATESQVPDNPGTTDEKKPRKKKEVDVAAMLETLLDRLCIWYSLDGGTPAKSAGNGDETGKDAASDDLRTFASEVVIPFWGSRIPSIANSTSKKLGGPSAPTPKRRSTAMPRKPGEPAVRQVPEKKPRKPLTRVSTDTLNHSGKRPPSLHRSATDSDALAPLIKREMSESPSIDSIPLAKHKARQASKQAPNKRDSLLSQVSLGRREVDLSAMSQANEAKMRKKAEAQERVRDAIATLRKPNRDRAVEEMAKQADESFARAISKGKGHNNTHAQRKVADKNAVAITATPRHVKATPAPRRRPQQEFGYSRISDTSVVPASSLRPVAHPGEIPSSTIAVPQTGHRSRTRGMEETPSRGFAKFMPPALAHEPGALSTLMESPTAARTTVAIGETPARMPKMAPLFMTPTAKGRTYSPMKKMSASPIRNTTAQRDDSGMVIDDEQPVGEQSIYDALGWNDDDYEQLV